MRPGPTTSVVVLGFYKGENQALEAYSASNPAARSYFCGGSESDVGESAFVQTVMDRSGVGDEGVAVLLLGRYNRSM